MDLFMSKKRDLKTEPKRGLYFLIIAFLLLPCFLGLFPSDAQAEIIGTLPPGSNATLKVDRSSRLKYNFTTFQRTLPDEFAKVYYDTPSDEGERVHGDAVNFYHTDGNRAVYCFEPQNPYIDEDTQNAYNVRSDNSPQSTLQPLTQEQRDMLAYVLAEGVTEYTNSSNTRQISTQLAVWVVGAGHYSNRWFNVLLPEGGTGIAPDAAICAEARSLVLSALNKVQGRPSFLESSQPFEMIWNGTAYEATLTDTKGKLTSSSEWGTIIIAELAKEGLTGTINDRSSSLTITGDPSAAGKNISLILTTAKKADIVFLENPITGRNSHQHYTIRQQMITVNTLDAAEAGSFRLFRAAVPTIATTAKNAADASKEAEADGPVTIIDTVAYTNLKPGTVYTIKGVLMDKETNAPLLINGEEVRKTFEFTPARANGTVDITFVISDASTLAGKTVVVFEDLYEGNHKWAAHADINDDGQSVKFRPKLRTSAINRASGGKTAQAKNISVTIVDAVYYDGLIIGESYTVKGVLMDKDSNMPLLVNGQEIRAEVTFTAEQKSGKINMNFVIPDASGLLNKTAVVFEDLYHSGIIIATHADINDKDQSIKFVPDNPDTGDTSNSGLWLSIMTASCLTVLGAVFFRRRRTAGH